MMQLAISQWKESSPLTVNFLNLAGRSGVKVYKVPEEVLVRDVLEGVVDYQPFCFKFFIESNPIKPVSTLEDVAEGREEITVTVYRQEMPFIVTGQEIIDEGLGNLGPYVELRPDNLYFPIVDNETGAVRTFVEKWMLSGRNISRALARSLSSDNFAREISDTVPERFKRSVLNSHGLLFPTHLEAYLSSGVLRITVGNVSGDISETDDVVMKEEAENHLVTYTLDHHFVIGLFRPMYGIWFIHANTLQEFEETKEKYVIVAETLGGDFAFGIWS